MSIPQRLLTTAEAAELVQLSQPHLEKARVYGGGPCYIKLGRSVRYRIEDLEAWITSGIVQSTSEPRRSTSEADRARHPAAR